MGSNISLPALNVRPPEQQNMAQQFFSLRSLLNQQQIQQQQIQAGQLENQQRQQALQSRAALVKTINDAGSDVSKVDLPTLIRNGVQPEEADSWLKAQASQAQAKAAQDSTTRAALEAIDKKSAEVGQYVRNIQDPTKRQQAYSSAIPQLQQYIASQQGLNPDMKQNALQMIAKLPPQVPGNDDLDAWIALHNHGAAQTSEVSAMLEKQASAAKSNAQAGEAEANTGKIAAQMPGIAAESQAKVRYAGPQAQAELGKTRAQTQEAIAATAKTKAETENLGQLPVFAVDPQTNQRVMTTRPEAQAKGYTNVVPVKEGDVQKQTDAVAMVNDTQLNLSRYRVAMNRMYQEPMNAKQMTALTALTPEKLGIDIGHGFGFSLPDVIQKVSNASAFSVLSPTQKQAMLGYYTTLASVPAAQKALTNIGKANKEMMDLELRTIPTPLMDYETYNLGMDRFQGNITQTAAKNVRIPGMPTAQSIREEIEGPPPDNRPQTNFNVPQPFNPSLSSLLGR